MKDDEIRFRAAVAELQAKGQAIDPAALAKQLDMALGRAKYLCRLLQPPKRGRDWTPDPKHRGRFLPKQAQAAPVVSAPSVAQPVVKDDAASKPAQAS